MLTFMRKHAYSWGTRALLGLITVVFMFWGISSGLFNQIHPIATVNGERILPDEVERQANSMRRMLNNAYGSNAAEVLKSMDLRQEALDQVIQSRLLQAEAKRIGIRVSDQALANAIASNKAFLDDGKFDFAAYQEVLRQNDLAPAEFEDSTRASLTEEALRNMVGETVQVSDDEAHREFNRRNENFELAYLEVPWQQFTAAINPTAAEVATYYKDNQETFRKPDQVKIEFIRYDPEVLADKTPPSDKEIQDYYDRSLKTQFTHPDEVHARHILVHLDETSSDVEKAAAKAKAEDILRQAKAGANFTKLAEKYSDDPGNKDVGGDLGFFRRGQMVKPFEDLAFSLKPGQMGIVQTEYGWHVVVVDDFRPAHVDTLTQARPEIIEALKRKAGSEVARTVLNTDLASALAGQDLKQLAAKRGLQAAETGLFAQDAPPPDLRNPRLLQDAFKSDKGDVRAEIVPGSDLYLIKVVDRVASHVPLMKEIEPAVRAALVRSKAESAAHQKAADLLKQIKGAADFDKAAAANKLEVKKTGEFDRAGEKVPGIGEFPEVTDAAAIAPKIPGLIDRVMQQQGNSYIFEVLSRKSPSDDEWKKQAQSFTEELLQARRAQAWERFVDELKQRADIFVDPNQIGGKGGEPSM